MQKNAIFIEESRPWQKFLHSYIWVCLFLGCSKGSTDQVNSVTYFQDNYLDRNYTIHLATDNGADLTAQYNGFVFRLVKGTGVDGSVTVTKNSSTWTGTWATNADYSKLTINLPAGVPEFVFLIREWKFTHKGIPILELAPWGTLDPKVLHMERL